MKFAKRLMMMVLAVAIVAPMVGCSVGATRQDNRRMLQRVARFDTLMLVDDIALFAQTNQVLRTSRWVVD
ncbi:MAG TPA: hypothetical protein VNT79_13275 [Phycisphaerae bacterium]|nr:hypothetical protein [Phycisphaerae bacterium]